MELYDLVTNVSRLKATSEGNEVPRGWPFGLGSMSSRITAEDASPPPPTTAAPQPYPSRNLRSSSFSSFSSSNLDTESTESFFPDRSVTLGRLIGMKPLNRGGLIHHHHHHLHGRQHDSEFSDKRSRLGLPKGQENSQGICAPLLHHVIGMMGRNGSIKGQ